jgi:hypothetical protein
LFHSGTVLPAPAANPVLAVVIRQPAAQDVLQAFGEDDRLSIVKQH